MGSQNNLVVVEYTGHLDVRYLHARVSVTLPEWKPRQIQLGVGIPEAWSTSALGEKAVKFIRLLKSRCRRLGLKSINLSEYQITLVKGTAFEWSPIQKEVLVTFSQVYLEEKPVIRRIKRIGHLWAQIKNI